ncbi:GH116 family glycosyl hydrolase [Fulvivirgaceae bacterium BMA10]|uniref:GH116 family glycosyl hydrolase n=1 Tax=Splendidivirga corallicola TaxID=3051826 RepID=A0ABT8KU27_9BACT|nr:GH116 family glycosyl hydrolase [Fulvivirgaceae bacterium BMA10]
MMKRSGKQNSRRKFLANSAALGALMAIPEGVKAETSNDSPAKADNARTKELQNKGVRVFNGPYKGDNLNRVAFPIGGIGAGMFNMEGTGGISHMSIRNSPDVFNQPQTFGAIHIKGVKNGTKVLEGPLQDWKKFGQHGRDALSSARGGAFKGFGLPRFKSATFDARFPFGEVKLIDSDIPVQVEIKGWSPFVPTDEDNSSLPVGAFEYTFKNTSGSRMEAVFSWNASNFMGIGKGNRIASIRNGFVLEQPENQESPTEQGAFAAFVPGENVTVDHSWFRGGWFDSLSIAWEKISRGDTSSKTPRAKDAPGASLYVPFTLDAGGEKTIRLLFAWYVPNTDIRLGGKGECQPASSCSESDTYKPWYAGKFANIQEVADYWKNNYEHLNQKSRTFTNAFYNATLPAEVMEAVAANLGILKSPTVLRQTDGKFWAWEGCNDQSGCCHGTCTHVWNYAQALPHLFPNLERSLRETEFNISQDDRGHQTFRTSLPIRTVDHGFHAAADGQLGGIMKVYRDWRISGDTEWMKKLYPKVKSSLDYCITTWDPKEKGILEEPHHNTYDIEFWGPDGMCTSFYLGALTALVEMAKAAKQPYKRYSQLIKKGKKYMEEELFDGEYFIQKIQWTGLEAKDPVKLSESSWTSDYSEEAKSLLQKEGPKYQYGKGCLSDGILGMWIASCAGLEEVIADEKVTSHLQSIHKYNLLKDMRNHSNPQRPSYALGEEGGLILCSWPKGGKLSLPFVYSNEVWTGIEYQVASHLMMKGKVEEGLDIVRTCRSRYDGTVRNPFDEYECGHWYARAMASYGLFQGLTGVRYDAVEKILYIDSRIGKDFTSFLSTKTGFGNVGLKDGKPFVDTKFGTIEIEKISVSGKLVDA